MGGRGSVGAMSVGTARSRKSFRKQPKATFCPPPACRSSVYVNDGTRLPRRAISHEHMKRDRRAIRFVEVGRHAVTRDIGAGAEAAGARADDVSDLSQRERVHL